MGFDLATELPVDELLVIVVVELVGVVLGFVVHESRSILWVDGFLAKSTTLLFVLASLVSSTGSSMPTTPLVDTHGRRHTSLRVSVTDRCNLRCTYCMPATDVEFAPRAELLTFEEISRVVTLLVNRFGFDDVRLTGGEPLVRRDLPVLVSQLAKIPGIGDLAMTTNGLGLPAQAVALRAAGLRRVNISIDAVDRDVVRQLTRRDCLDAVLAGIDAAVRAGFDSVKLNALAIAGITESQLVGLCRLAAGHGVTLRLIEFMPLDADRAWTDAAVLTGDACLALLQDAFGEITPIGRDTPSQPAEQFEFRVDGRPLRFGLIRSVTRPFCGDCNRLRLTADGRLRNCLFSHEETPLRELLRGGADDDTIAAAVESCVAAKRAGHGIDDPNFVQPVRTMHAIGG